MHAFKYKVSFHVDMFVCASMNYVIFILMEQICGCKLIMCQE